MGVIKKKPTKKQEGKKMKITIDKKYTEEYMMDQIKADVAEFKKAYSEKDLLAEFARQVSEDGTKFYVANPEIIMTKVVAFPAGYAFDNVTHFAVDMVLDEITRMYKIRFYCDMSLTVNTNNIGDSVFKMYTIETFMKEY